MRFLLSVFAVVACLFSVQADVNVNFQDLFKGLDLSQPAAPAPTPAPDAECVALKLHDLASAFSEKITHDIDNFLYKPDGSGNLNKPSEIDWVKNIYGTFVDPPELWSGAVIRPSNMWNQEIDTNQGGWKQWWAGYYWPYQYYTSVDWQLISRAMSFDPDTQLIRVITTAINTFQNNVSKANFRVIESYNSFYRILDDTGKTRQVKFVFTQESYDWGKDWGVQAVVDPTNL